MTDQLKEAVARIVSEQMRCDYDGGGPSRAAGKILSLIASEGGGWRDIESAPRDGTSILVTAQHGPPASRYYSVARWEDANNEGAGWFDGTVGSWAYEELLEIHPTHWRPLPDPPAGLQTNAGGGDEK